MKKKTIELDGIQARNLFKTSPPEWKKILIDNYGVNFFEKKITDRVKTFKDACEVLGIPEPQFMISDADWRGDNASIIAYTKMITIVRALNEGWEPNWSDSNELKYYPAFKATSSGSGFACTHYDNWLTHTIVGSRLCFRTSELAEYAGTQFIDIYKPFINL